MQHDSSAIAAVWTPQPPRLRPSAWLATLTVFIAIDYFGSLWQLGLPSSALATIATVGIASLLSGIAGIPFPLVSGPILLLFGHDALQASQIMLMCCIAYRTLAVWALRRDIRLHALFAANVCIPPVVWLLPHLDANTYEKAFGMILLVYGAAKLIGPRNLPRKQFIVRIVSSLPAAPAIQSFILLAQIVTLASIAIMHPNATPATLSIASTCVPAALAGTWWGTACSRRRTISAGSLLLIFGGAALAL